MFLNRWVQYCSNTETDSRLIFACENQRHLTAVRTPLIESFRKGFGETFDLERDSDSLLAGSGLHQIDFDSVRPCGAYFFPKGFPQYPYHRLISLRPVIAVDFNVIVSQVAAPSGGGA